MESNAQSQWTEPDPGGERFSLWQLYEYRTRFSPLPLVVTEGKQHLVRYANPAFCALAEMGPMELEGVPFAEVVARGEGNGKECVALLDRVFTTGETENSTDPINVSDPESQRYWAYSVWAVLDEQACPPGVMIQVADVSRASHDHRRGTAVGEALMLFSVKRQEFQEVAETVIGRLEQGMHESEHRSKNSVQIVSSRLSQQLREFPVAVPALELVKLQLQIKTIATMHDLLTFSDTDVASAKITDVKKMLLKLLPMWKVILNAGHLECDCDEIHMSIRRCTSLLTIINELICNSVKYGARVISLKLFRAEDSITLDLSDNGSGFPAGFKVQASGSFGLKFVEAVIRSELIGTVLFENTPQGGAHVKISFPLQELEISPPALS